MIIYIFASIGVVASLWLIALYILKFYTKMQIKFAIARKFREDNKTIAEMHEVFAMLDEYSNINTPIERKVELKDKMQNLL